MSEARRLRRDEGYGAHADEKRRKETYMQKKTEIITARMTPEVKKRLQERAQDVGMTLTMYLTICGLGQEIVRVDGLDAIL